MSVIAPAPPPRTPPRPDELEALIREARARQRRRWVLEAAAIAAVTGAALGIYGALAGATSKATDPGAEAPASLASLPRCRSSQLNLAVPKMWGAAAGSLIEQFTLTNISHTTCAVAGWPAVRRFNSSGKPIPTKLQRWVYTQRGPAPFRVVRLRPRGLATFPVFGQDWNHATDRACREATSLRVEPRGAGGWLTVAADIPACRRWNVGPIRPGRAAPWPPFALSMFHRTQAHP